MRRWMWIILAGMLVISLGALAQQVIQSGKPIPGHAGKWITNLTMGDAGPANGGAPGTGLTELNITSTLNNGLPFCINDAPTTGPFHQVCVGANAQGGGLLSYNAFGGATPLPFNCVINGVQIANCLNGGVAPANSITLVSTFGADLTGATDATTPLQNCINTVGSGGMCMVDPGAKLKILGNIVIPRNTTLMCGFTFLDSEDGTNIPNYAAETAIMLDPGHTISAAGEGATIENCLIYRNGMTFPANGASAFTGVAVSDAGNSNFTMIDSVVIGFATCLYDTGSRPYVRRSFFDCAGNSTVGKGAAVEIDNGNTDSGWLDNIKIQPLATGNGNCSSSLRPGIGLAISGINFLDGGIVSQNFQQDQIYINAPVIANGTLWSDALGGTCGYGSSVGIVVGPSGSLTAQAVNVNSTQVGLSAQGATVSIGQFFANLIGQDCIDIMNGYMQIGQFTTNIGNTTGNCGRYATEIPTTASNAVLKINQAIVNGVNGNRAPYFHSSLTGPVLPNALSIDQVVLGNELPVGTNPYGGFYQASGSDAMMAPLSMVGSPICTGLGGSNTCSFQSGSNAVRGIVVMTTAGTPAASGTVQLTFPLQVASGRPCAFSYVGSGWAALGPAPPLDEGGVSPSTVQVQWSAGAPLVTGSTYSIAYQCSAF